LDGQLKTVSSKTGAGDSSRCEVLSNVSGAVLVGGKSVRMGRDKQAMGFGGATFTERAVAAMRQHVECVVLIGSGSVPTPLAEMLQLPDVPHVAGPMAGVLAAMRRDPAAAWMVAACDMPEISGDAILWLLSQRGEDVLAVMPRSREGRVEPLLAVYEPWARPLLEERAAAGRWGLRHLAGDPRVRCPKPPAELMAAWSDVNTPQELKETAKRLYHGACRA
jgi:molybdopterin-guanine dinucleotide biosynthesis protein A